MEILRTPAHWKSVPYVLVCPMPDCDTEFTDKAHEWAHSWFHITDNKQQLKKYLQR